MITPPDVLSGLLVAVISGNRPLLSERPTVRLLDALSGVNDVVWVVNEREAYESDGREIVTYPDGWAYEYAKAHWMNPKPPHEGGFYGAFAGREWACLEAERRGCWGVLQLDDNIEHLVFPRGTAAGHEFVRPRGGLGWFADLLAAVSRSTNAMMTGAALNAVPRTEMTVARAGFPYSLFIEKVQGREPWYGPFEDDITHAFQYGNRPDAVTAAIMPMLRYMKEHKATTGMRSRYENTRAVQLQRMFPESAKFTVKKAKSNGRGGPRAFHQMVPGAVRNKLRVTDSDLFGQVKADLEAALVDWRAWNAERQRDKVRKRARSLA